MIPGKKWPIPLKKIMDGSSLSLKNAERLLKDAKNAKANNNYELTISQAILALEELGKALILWECVETNTKIDKKFWHNNLEYHEKKLTGITENLKKFTPTGHIQAKKQLVKMEKLLKKFAGKKLQAIYLDWDPSKNDWFLFSEKSKPTRKKEAAEVFTLAEWLIQGYSRDGQFITERSDKVIQMLKSKNVHAFCRTCSKTMFTIKEILFHRRLFHGHVINFVKN